MKNIKYKFKIALLIFIILTSFLSCREKENDDNNNITWISKWVYDWMYDLYLWYDHMPIIKDFTTKIDPESFFYNELLYKEEDRWSYITSNFSKLESELIKGNPKSMGFYPIFGLYGNNYIAIIVAYVYPNSPAARAGLKRGDIITKINGNYITQFNYYDLYNQESYNATISKYVADSFTEIKTITLNAEIINSDPIIFDTIFNINNKKIGYLVYVQFINGKNNIFKDHLQNTFEKFKNENITNLIIDLRYNPGGEIENALFLGSLIAPTDVVKNNNIFIKLNYNDKVQKFFLDEEGPESENLILKFDNTVNSLNINKVYFLTTNQTASASELLIIGLKPYFKDDLKIIGSNTYGKYVGSFLIYDFENNPRKHDWAIMPIVLKYSNAEDYTGFKDGLTPDIELKEDFLDLKKFGDINDPFIYASINDMYNNEIILQQTKKIEPFTNILENPANKIKSNLIINSLKKIKKPQN